MSVRAPGMVIGNATLLERLPSTSNSNRNRRWRCRCSCGATFDVWETAFAPSALKAGRLVSCGHGNRVYFPGFVGAGVTVRERIGDDLVVACDEGHTWSVKSQSLSHATRRGRRLRCLQCISLRNTKAPVRASTEGIDCRAVTKAMRTDGLTFTEIGATLGVGRERARQYYYGNPPPAPYAYVAHVYTCGLCGEKGHNRRRCPKNCRRTDYVRPSPLSPLTR